MGKINWAQKLTSRKFWAAVIGFITAMLFMFGVKEPTVGQIIGAVTACATMIGYIVGEGMVDAARVKGEASGTSGEK